MSCLSKIDALDLLLLGATFSTKIRHPPIAQITAVSAHGPNKGQIQYPEGWSAAIFTPSSLLSRPTTEQIEAFQAFARVSPYQVEETDVGSLAEGVDDHRTDNYLHLLANVTA